LSFFLLGNPSVFKAQQNLIPDPGFENWTDSVFGVNMPALEDWFSANGTPDHHSIYGTGSNLSWCDTTCLPNTTGGNDCGAPFKGNSVGGFYRANGRAGSKEWARTQLTEPMELGSCYMVSFWIKNQKDRPWTIARIDTIYAPDGITIIDKDTTWFGPYMTNHWGAYFSEGPVIGFSPNLYDFSTIENQIVNMDTIADNSLWEYYEEVFHADAAYDHAFFGYVGNWDDEVSVIANTNGQLGAYVWMDEISVSKIPSPSFYGGLTDSIVCLGDSILLTAYSDTLMTLSYNGVDLGTDSLWVVANEIGTFTYTASSTWSDECDLMTDFNIIVPDMKVSAKYYSIDTLSCPLEGICHGVIELTVTEGFEPYSYVWEDAPELNDSVRRSLCNGPICVDVSDASHCPTDVHWCIDLDLLERVAAPVPIELPNIITPDGDGKNDVFQPALWLSDGSAIGLGEAGDFVDRVFDYHLTVVNRWGTVLFDSTDPLEIWSDIEGQVGSGTYFYSLQYKESCYPDELQTREGSLVIIVR
jgi:hypothetical protein